jgi:hypothetical protein
LPGGANLTAPKEVPPPTATAGLSMRLLGGDCKEEKAFSFAFDIEGAGLGQAYWNDGSGKSGALCETHTAG